MVCNWRAEAERLPCDGERGRFYYEASCSTPKPLEVGEEEGRDAGLPKPLQVGEDKGGFEEPPAALAAPAAAAAAAEGRDKAYEEKEDVPVVTLELGGGLNASSIKEGVDVYFECNIKSNPWVYKVCWKHNGRDLMNNASAGIFVSNQSLVLQGVQKESAGLYTCVASNQEGDGESNPLLLSIRYAPVCRDSAPRIIGAAKGEPVKIPCEVEANPDTGLHFRWQLNTSAGQLVDLSPASYSVADRLRSVALFTPALEHDFSSQLICAASNAAGEQRQPCIFQLTPAGKPDQPTNCSIVNQTADALRIECMEGFDGGLTQQFVMEVYDAQTQMLVGNVTSSTAHFTIAQLHSGIGFDILLYAANGKGISRPTTLHAYTLKSAERRTAETPIIPHLTPLLGALIGVVVSLVLVLLAVLLALRLRGRSHFEDKTNEAVKGSSESADSLDKNPDIIPQNDDYQDADERAFEKLNSRPYVAHISADKPRGEVTYAELSLPSSVYSTLIRQKQQQHHQQLPPPCQGVGVGVPGQGVHLGGLQGQGGPPPGISCLLADRSVLTHC
ncbi:nephrin [Nilaparvata lugens]|uniref:nephrin n=1 Tax=Nilaparvata lugens TaxID=108931 RepID=UPI00193CE692|nr:nephrin [Nilaparvata lugens]